jgi:hypothetical protein
MIGGCGWIAGAGRISRSASIGRWTGIAATGIGAMITADQTVIRELISFAARRKIAAELIAKPIRAEGFVCCDNSMARIAARETPGDTTTAASGWREGAAPSSK